MKHTIFLNIIILFLLFTQSCSSRPKVLMITSPFISQTEIDSLARIIKDSGKDISSIPVDMLQGKSLKGISAVVYHRTDSSEISIQELEMREKLIPYVRNGGKLFLSMEAVKLLNLWDIEPQQITMELQDATDSGFGRALGFHGYREHPVFEGLSGGAYVWKSTHDHMARTHGFSDGYLPKAQGAGIIGINWAYIHYHEGRKLLWETPVGNGSILAAGAYLYFAPENRNKSSLELFMTNVMDYLCSSRKFNSKARYWRYDSIPVEKTDDFVFNPEIVPDRQYDADLSEMGIKRAADSNNFWDLAGQRILVMGKEKGKIDEVWIHPVMALRDLSVGIKNKGSDSIQWLEKLHPEISRSPHLFERNYGHTAADFKESVVVSPTRPVMNVNYSWDNECVDSVYICMTSNLRLMWPYSLDSTGTLFYSHDKDNAVTVVFDRDRNLNLVAAFDHSPSSLSEGMVDFRHRLKSDFHKIPAKNKQITFLYGFGASGGSLSLCVSGGEDGLDNASGLISEYVGNSRAIYQEATDYYDSLNDNLLSIESSDSIFNMAYRMAMMSTNRFFCHTPSIGKSLMAGFCTTARGWNGNHSVSGRPGYAWYFGRDTEWTGTVMNLLGDYDKVKEILYTFGKFQDPDGKIYHELTTSGSVHYDAADATPLYIMLAGDYLRKSGDTAFIRSQWDRIMKAVAFCKSTDTDGDGLIENTGVGHGWQEAYQLHGAHTEVYLASIWGKALEECQYMAEALDKKELALGFQKEASEVVNQINQRFWNDSTGFFNHGLMKDGSFQKERCVLGGTPVIFRQTDMKRARQVALNFSDRFFSTDWGVRMVGYESPFFATGGYTYGNIWPFHTGCAATAEYNAGLYTQGYRHAYSSLRLFDMWNYGNLPEVILGDALKFTGICPDQQWSASMNLKPLLEGMLGIETDAVNNVMSIAPAFPPEWSHADVRNVKMGKNSLDMGYKREHSHYVYTLTPSGECNADLRFKAVLPMATEIKDVTINGATIPHTVSCDENCVLISVPEIKMSEPKVIEIAYSGGIGVMSNLPEMTKGMQDTGLKIEEETFDRENRRYALKLAGVPGKTYSISIFSKSEISSIISGEIINESGDIKDISITFPESSDPFVTSYVEITLAQAPSCKRGA